jgi:WD40 repeat protein
MQIVHVYTCLDTIDSIQWSGDSQYVFVVIYQRGIVQVWSIEKPDWTCRITEGLAGLVAARWAPDSRSVLTTADFQIHLTAWNLTDGSAVAIKNPKNAGPVRTANRNRKNGLDFSPDGQFMALAHRIDCRDTVGIYSTSTWGKATEFATGTVDMDDLSWSPDGSVICVSDTELNYSIIIFSPDGKRLSRYSAYENALGVKSVAWNPAGTLLAVGSYDQNARLMTHASWNPIAELVHTVCVSPGHAHVYCEVVVKGQGMDVQTAYELASSQSRLKSVNPDPTKPNPRIGISTMGWSYDGKFLATKNDNMPHAVWIWTADKLRLYAVLIHRNVVRSFSWSPTKPTLAVCTGINKVFFWNPSGASWVDIPSNDFDVRGLRWNPQGTSILFLQTKQMCACFFDGPNSVTVANGAKDIGEETEN